MTNGFWWRQGRDSFSPAPAPVPYLSFFELLPDLPILRGFVRLAAIRVLTSFREHSTYDLHPSTMPYQVP
jgi:hypothetical protein